ncbi:MAG: hypothetical protein CO189_01755 [candidate division Zixibacteria bacterium CG_4_9_14_3_um_filter_46_8]|nr:MAG: hypothetical protein CO189_01755 [candidate division Zixibacteria bacterium CG_4_9_14_3_um_filter_46_8]
MPDSYRTHSSIQSSRKMEKQNKTAFICDDNLGKLAKLLKACGYDTLFQKTIADGELIAKALAEDRTIISRDRRLARKGAPENLLIIKTDDPDEQLKDVLLSLGLKPEFKDWLTRCLECNILLAKVSKEENKNRIPPYVFFTQSEFFKCSNCDKLFWKGTHHQRMMERLLKIMG